MIIVINKDNTTKHECSMRLCCYLICLSMKDLYKTVVEANLSCCWYLISSISEYYRDSPPLCSVFALVTSSHVLRLTIVWTLHLILFSQHNQFQFTYSVIKAFGSICKGNKENTPFYALIAQVISRLYPTL